MEYDPEVWSQVRGLILAAQSDAIYSSSDAIYLSNDATCLRKIN
jgi:hypothetical protein